MAKRRLKCDKCHGKGGYMIARGNGFVENTWLACQQCRGRGGWWPNNGGAKKVKR